MKYVNEVKCRSILNRSGIPGTDYGINPYIGCAHKCQYCYAVFMKKFTGHTEPWGDFVDAKVNAPEVLSRQLKRLKRSQEILFGTVCDAYQPLEKKLRITRKCLQALLPYDHSVSILTKSPLVTRDIDILTQLSSIEVGFTITTLTPKVLRVYEPGALPPTERFRAMKMLAKHGIRTWVFVAPVLPFLGDSKQSILQIVQKARKAGASYIMFDTLNPYPKVWHNVKQLARKHFPEALPHFHAYHDDTPRYAANLKRKISSIGFEHLMPARFAFGCGG